MATQQLQTPSEEDVLEAGARIVRAYSATDTDAYFASFDPECTFVFHPEPDRLDSRADYEALWNSWLAEGWRVLACTSTDRTATTFPGGAVFVHGVETTVWTGIREDSYRERETIVFRTTATGGLLAVHEHLSPMPAA